MADNNKNMVFQYSLFEEDYLMFNDFVNNLS